MGVFVAILLAAFACWVAGLFFTLEAVVRRKPGVRVTSEVLIYSDLLTPRGRRSRNRMLLCYVLFAAIVATGMIVAH